MVRAGRWWAGRSRREQGMLAGLALLLALVACWYGVVAPLQAWRDAAAARHAAAAADHALVAAAVGQGADRPVDPAELERRVRAAAEPYGLVIEAAQADGEGGLDVSVDSAGSAQLFPCIWGLEREQGLIIGDLTVLENADATLQAQVGVSGSQR